MHFKKQFNNGVNKKINLKCQDFYTAEETPIRQSIRRNILQMMLMKSPRLRLEPELGNKLTSQQGGGVVTENL